MHTKFIFVTGGVVSSLGKGITAASLGRLLKSRGLRVSMQKFDPYINVDPGTMNPYQHGEVFVTDDGAETDLDLGHYERFIDENLTQAANVTSGRVYDTVITRERKGEYLGATIQVIPHITDEIKRRMLAVSLREDAPDVVITEIGGTVGDIESLPFLEAARQLKNEVGRENVLYIHVTLVPYISAAGELKTKPTQHSVKELTGLGIQPDIIVCRSEKALTRDVRAKIGLFCNIPADCVFENLNARSIYEVPLMIHEEGMDERVCRLLGLRRQHTGLPPRVTPSRFSPVEDSPEADLPRTPTLPRSLTPEDAAFLRRVMPQLQRVRAARTPPTPAPCILSEDCALAAAVFALCGRRLGESRYIQAAQRAVGYLAALSPALPPSYSPVSALNAQLTCGAGAALALALLTLGQAEELHTYRESGLRLLGAALHAFTTPDGLPMHTPQDAAAFFPRIPAVWDSELPSPAALLLHALALADACRPQAGYKDAALVLWQAAAPYARQQPLACAGLIDAAHFTLSESREAPA